MKEPMIWTYNQTNVYFDPETEMGSLTAMWEACERPGNQDPRQWLRLPQADAVIGALCESLNVEKSHILETRQGRNGGTWAHWQIATVYAHYLDPKFYLWWNEQARAHIEGCSPPAGFGQFIAQLMVMCDGAEAKIARVRRLAKELGQAVYDLPQELDSLRMMIPIVEDRQIADPATIGYVYVFRIKGTSEYKIGKTGKTAEERKKKLSGPLGTPLEDVAVVMTDDPDLLEKRIQRFYKNKRVPGKREVFHLSDQDVVRIQSLDEFITAELFDSSELEIYKQQEFMM